MVSRSRATATDRAQLILVGAIAIGIVLVAMTTIINSAVFTENVAQGNAVEVTGDVQEFDHGTVRNARSLAIRINHANVYKFGGGGENQLRADLAENVSAFSDIVAESHADTGSVLVNVTYEGETFGGRVVQDGDREFKEHPGNGSGDTWSLVDDSFELGWFVMNVDVENVSETDPVFVEITDTAGSELNVSLRQTSDGNLDVRSEIDGGNVSDVTCEPTNGRVLLDVADGHSHTGDCTFNATGHLEPTLAELRFVNGDNGEGKYDVAVNRSDHSSFSGVPNCAGGNDPCLAVAAWTINVTTHYGSGSVEFERTHEVEVYGG